MHIEAMMRVRSLRGWPFSLLLTIGPRHKKQLWVEVISVLLARARPYPMVGLGIMRIGIGRRDDVVQVFGLINIWWGYTALMNRPDRKALIFELFYSSFWWPKLKKLFKKGGKDAMG